MPHLVFLRHLNTKSCFFFRLRRFPCCIEPHKTFQISVEWALWKISELPLITYMQSRAAFRSIFTKLPRGWVLFAYQVEKKFLGAPMTSAMLLPHPQYPLFASPHSAISGAIVPAFFSVLLIFPKAPRNFQPISSRFLGKPPCDKNCKFDKSSLLSNCFGGFSTVRGLVTSSRPLPYSDGSAANSRAWGFEMPAAVQGN